MCTIFDRQQQTQHKGAKHPRFRHPQSDLDPFTERHFKGPLFQVITLKGSNAFGQPLPRLLLDFFRAFNHTCDIWRNRDLNIWSLNRELVVKIAKNYIRDRVYGRHGNLDRTTRLVFTTLSCPCCTERLVGTAICVTPCLLCEFNAHLIALLFRFERPRIVAHQLVQRILLKHIPQLEIKDKDHKTLSFHIAEYVSGSSLDSRDGIETLKKLVVDSILFCQDFKFAPEIRSIISRQQFNIWAEGVRGKLLRPFRQDPQSRNPDYPYVGRQSVGAQLLRAYPAELDAGFPGTIYYSYRVPEFPTLTLLYPPPSNRVIQSLRLDNVDAWVALAPGSRYVQFERQQSGWAWIEDDEFWSAESGSDDESV